ncbi:hypothetical protein QL285_044270 [Trifolium repens]|nr:hypothetical protein QL285_044270 [Trifolium repens]
MVRDLISGRIHTHSVLTIHHLSITNTSQRYDKTTKSVNTECLRQEKKPPSHLHNRSTEKSPKKKPLITSITHMIHRKRKIKHKRI